ncbi:hypothetical protein [Leifsonia sp. EB34]|uniref:competence protein CoiA family protein n=1 Tax=Leifsonia sp. EB34 TaxID=3156303 RepID=UPI00351482E8
MPMVGLLAGERVEAWTHTPASWEQLKREYPKLGLTMLCGQPGIPVRSGKGVFFFRHKHQHDCLLYAGADETPEHHQAEQIVAQVATRLGWKATIERAADDRTWIADVYLEHAALPKPLAVEIQWSRQSNENFHRRQDRYANAGVDGLWIIGPVNTANVDGVPNELMEGVVDHLEMRMPTVLAGDSVMLPLDQAVELLLNTRLPREARPEGAVALSPVSDLVVTDVELAVQRINCWNDECGRPLTVWRVSGYRIESRCGQHAVVRDLSGYRQHATERPELRAQKRVCEAIAASSLPAPTSYAKRFTKKAGFEYIAHVCPYCRSVEGDAFLNPRDRYSIPWRARVPFRDDIADSLHPCRNTSNGWCHEPEPAEPPLFPAPESRVEFTVTAPENQPLPRPIPQWVRVQDPPWKSPAQKRREEAAAKAERDKLIRAEAAKRIPEWEISPERAKLLTAFNGEWPEYLRFDTASILPVPAEMWQGHLYLRFIHGRSSGDIDPKVLAIHLRKLGPENMQVDAASNEWLRHLVDRRLLTGKLSGWRSTPSRFLFIVDQNPRRPAPQPGRPATPELVELAIPPTPEPRQLVSPPAQPPTPGVVREHRCVFCGITLDPIFYDQGYHNVCAPGWRPGSRSY